MIPPSQQRGSGRDLRWGSWNVGQGLEAKIYELLDKIEKHRLDIVMLQDTGIRTRGDLIGIQGTLRARGFCITSKSYDANPQDGYTADELKWLHEDYVRKQEGKPPDAEEDGYNADQSRRCTLAIIYKNDVRLTVIPSGLPSSRHQRVRIHLEDRQFEMVNIYAPVAGQQSSVEGHDRLQEALTRIVNEAREREGSVYLGGDLNATAWPRVDRQPPRDRSEEDERLHEFLEAAELVDAAAREGEPREHTYVHTRTSSRIDALLVMRETAATVGPVAVTRITAMDHALIFAELHEHHKQRRRRPAGPPPEARFKLPSTAADATAAEKAQWTRYAHAISSNLGPSYAEAEQEMGRERPSAHKIDQTDELLYKAIKAAAKSAFKTIRQRRPRHNWNDTIYRLGQTRKRLDKLKLALESGDANRIVKAAQKARHCFPNRANGTRLIPTWAETEKARQDVMSKIEKEVRTDKKRLWEEHKTEAEEQSERRTAQAFKGFTRAGQQGSLEFISSGGKTISDPKEVLRLTRDHQERITCMPDPPQWPGPDEPPWQGDWSDVEPMEPLRIDEDTWSTTLRRLKRGKAAGEDAIPYELVLGLPRRAKELVRKMLDASLRIMHTPARWKRVVLRPLLKKGDPTLLDNYRMVALAIAFSKVRDVAVTLQTSAYAEENYQLDDGQFGFRRGRTIAQALAAVDVAISYALRNNQPVMLMEMDVAKAFPSVVWNTLTTELRRRKMGALASYVESLYQGTTFVIRTKGGTSEPGQWKAGVLEGMASSPIIFALYLDSLIRWMKTDEESMRVGNVEIPPIFVADDGNVLAPGQQAMQRQVDRLGMWGFYHRFRLHPTKTIIACANLPIQQMRVYMPERYAHGGDPNAHGWVEVKCVNEHYEFRALGIHRSLRDRRTAHQRVLEARLSHYIYNLLRVPATEEFLVRVVESMVSAQLTFAAGLVDLTKAFVKKMEKRVKQTLRRCFGCKMRFNGMLLESMEAYGRRNLWTTWQAATLSMAVRIQTNTLVRSILEQEMMDIALATNGAPPWALIHQEYEATNGTLVGTVQRILREYDVRISSLDGVLSGHWNKPILWKYSGRQEPGPQRSDIPTRGHTRPGFVPTPRSIYEKMRAKTPGRFITTDDTMSPLRGTLNIRRQIMDGNGARLQHLTASPAPWDDWLKIWTVGQRWARTIGPWMLSAKEQEPDVRPVAKSERTVKVAILASTRARNGRRGPQDAAAAAHSFDDELLCMTHRASGTQTAHHASAALILEVLRRIQVDQKIQIATPMGSVADQIRDWRSWTHLKRVRHPYKLTMEALVQECERHSNAVILVIPAERMATWDARLTREFIETTNTRGRRGVIRERAAAARQTPEPRRMAPDRALGIVIHTEDKTKFFEGDAAAIVYNKADAKMRQQLRENQRTREYFDDEAHPATWELARKHPKRTQIWRMRMGIMPTGDFINELGMEDDMGGVCMCGTRDDPEEETLRHILMDCRLYEDLRIPDTPTLREALGYVAQGDYSQGNNLEERKKRARKRMDAAWKIWCERNRLRAMAKARMEDQDE